MSCSTDKEGYSVETGKKYREGNRRRCTVYAEEGAVNKREDGTAGCPGRGDDNMRLTRRAWSWGGSTQGNH